MHDPPPTANNLLRLLVLHIVQIFGFVAEQLVQLATLQVYKILLLEVLFAVEFVVVVVVGVVVAGVEVLVVDPNEFPQASVAAGHNVLLQN